jgi:hypothetical protein
VLLTKHPGLVVTLLSLIPRVWVRFRNTIDYYEIRYIFPSLSACEYWKCLLSLSRVTVKQIQALWVGLTCHEDLNFFSSTQALATVLTALHNNSQSCSKFCMFIIYHQKFSALKSCRSSLIREDSVINITIILRIVNNLNLFIC